MLGSAVLHLKAGKQPTEIRLLVQKINSEIHPWGSAIEHMFNVVSYLKDIILSA
jgi:hypothetical protein